MENANKRWCRGAVAILVMIAGASCAGTVHAQSAPAATGGIGDFLSKAKPIIDARFRYEHVEQSGFVNDADAATLRLRAGIQTGKAYDLQFLAEMEGIAHLNETFNDTVNGQTRYPGVADPESGELNRLQVEYSGLPKTAVTVGRQRINLDNQRFIGAAGFRQNEQTFDAARVTSSYVPGLDATYIYIKRVNRVFGNTSTQGKFTGDSHVINAGYALPVVGKLTGYAYLLDLEQSQVQSTATYGARLTGKQTMAPGMAVVYEAEYAKQKNYKNNPLALDLNYLHGEGGVTWQGITALGGVESLQGNGVRGFATPLATGHRFQGYADVFLTTPANGLVGPYGKLGYDTPLTLGPVTALSAAGWYRKFNAYRGGASLGHEIDAEATFRFGKQIALSLIYADYKGVTGFASRKKTWVALEYIY
jgi:hypothetical protein